MARDGSSLMTALVITPRASADPTAASWLSTSRAMLEAHRNGSTLKGNSTRMRTRPKNSRTVGTTIGEPLGLRGEELCVLAAEGDQLVVRALLGDLTVLQDDDLV